MFILMVLFGIAVNSSSNSGYPGLTIFEEEGKCTGAKQIKIMQTLEPDMALAYAKTQPNAIYDPKDNGKTSEIDVIMLHPKGLFVIESKNYSGWIFGNESNKQWTQTLPVSYGKSHKERFYNPIMQNATHIRAIRKHINDTIPIYSVIAFSDNCTLKDVTVKSNVIVAYYSELKKEIKLKLSEINNYTITPELMDETYNKLSQYANVDDYTKFQHIYNSR